MLVQPREGKQLRTRMSVDLDQTPRCLLVWDRSSFLDEKNRINSQMQQLHFNYKVSVLLPGCSSLPPPLESATSFNHFYLVKKLLLRDLLDKRFLEAAVYPGGLYALSYRTRIDEDNCAALMPNGRLVLSLDKDSFQVLGFEGKPSTFTHRSRTRYVVTINLNDRSMAPGGQGYVRLLEGLTSRLPLQMDFLLSHSHPGDEASFQALLSQYDWSKHTPEVSTSILTHLACPDLRSCDPHSLLEWFGAVDADISSENSSGSFLSTLICPEPKTTLGQLLRVSVCGLLLPQDVYNLVQKLRRYLEQLQPESWASVTVHGFVDSPVSWGGREHGVLCGGENLYTLLMFQDHTYYLHLATGAHDSCPP